MSDSIITKLHDLSVQKLNPSYQSIARYILTNLDDMYEMKIEELANLSFVSAPTVNRFCNQLGYDGWKHFFNDLREYLEMTSRGKNYITSNHSKTDVLNYKNQIIKNLDRITTINFETLLKIKEILSKTTDLYLFGVASNFITLEFFASHFLSKKLKIHYSKDLDTQKFWIDNIVEKGATFFFFTYTGLSMQLNTVIQNFKNLPELNTIVFTSNKNSFLWKNTDLQVQLFENESSFENKNEVVISSIYIACLISIIQNENHS